MLLGAGIGTRLAPFTSVLPKPLIPIMGIPCIDFALDQLQRAGLKEVVVNVHAHASLMNQHLAMASGKFSRRANKAAFKITVSDESSELLGSAGGFRKALENFKSESFFGINADVLSTVDLAALERRHHELRKSRGVVMTLAMVAGKNLATQTEQYRELFMDQPSGLITGFGEKKQNVPFYSGIGIFESEAFEHLEKDKSAEFVAQVLEPAIKQNKVGFFEYEGLWIDVGSPELWWQAHLQLQRRMMLGQGHGEADALPESWQEMIQTALQAEKVQLNQPWAGWIRYGKDATPQNFLGKKGIQLDNLIYECKS